MGHCITTGEIEEDSAMPTWIIVCDGDPYGGVPIQSAVAKCRMAYGAMLEVFARQKALATIHPKYLPSGAGDVARFARNCSDAYFAALWIDAHVQFAMNVVDNGPMAEITVPLVHATFGTPCVRLAASISSLPLIAGQLESFLAGKTFKGSASKEILTLLARCTQSGSRGWEPALKAGLQNDLVKHVCTSALVASLLGMHPQLHPACRPSWEERLLMRSVIEPAMACNVDDVLCQCNVAVKESIRIYMCSMLADTPASRAAYAASGHSIGMLASAPVELANPALQAAAQNLVRAGMSASKVIGTRAASDATRQLLIDEVLKCIGTEARCRKRQAPSASSTSSEAVSTLALTLTKEQQQLQYQQQQKQHTAFPIVVSAGGGGSALGHVPVVYVPSWISRTQPQPSSMPHSLRAVDVASEILSRSFRMHFVPVWVHAHGHGIRASRLDACQQQHVHNTSPTHRVTSLLDERIVLKLQRDVAVNPFSYSTSVVDLTKLINVDEATTARLASCKNMEAAVAVITSLDATRGAQFLTYCKIASLKEKMLCYDLGPTTRERQLRALRLRFDLRDSDDVERDLPHHAKYLYWCLECGRVPNACVEPNSRDVPHNEVGVSQTMFRVGALGCSSDIRCARRSSAALRTALQKEDDAVKHRIDQIEVNEGGITKALEDNGDVSHAARLRRDVKSCAEQHAHALACGDQRMVKIPLIGHCVRVHSKFYSICCCCGSVMHVDASMRFGSELCCNRCDPTMMGAPATTHNNSGSSSSRGKSVGAASQSASTSKNMPTDSVFRFTPDQSLPCRFCGKPAPSGAASKFKVVRSPLDTSGRNSRLPPPLRTVAYCSTHFRAWVENAHMTMDSRVILSHISEKAAPVFGAETGRRNGDRELLRLTHVKPARGRASSAAASIEKRIRMNRRASNANKGR